MFPVEKRFTGRAFPQGFKLGRIEMDKIYMMRRPPGIAGQVIEGTVETRASETGVHIYGRNRVAVFEQDTNGRTRGGTQTEVGADESDDIETCVRHGIVSTCCSQGIVAAPVPWRLPAVPEFRKKVQLSEE